LDAIESLMREHRIIERGLNLLEEVALRMDRGERVDLGVIKTLLRFFKEFADKCHHGKEEEHLFPLLESKGIPREGGPIGVMLLEHQLGRGYIRAMEEALEMEGEEARRAFIDNALDYVTLLREHIFKEDNVLFSMAQAVISSEDNRKLVEEFESIELERLGPGVHEELAKSLDSIEKALTSP